MMMTGLNNKLKNPNKQIIYTHNYHSLHHTYCHIYCTSNIIKNWRLPYYVVKRDSAILWYVACTLKSFLYSV